MCKMSTSVKTLQGEKDERREDEEIERTSGTKDERLRKVRQRIQMRIGVSKMEDVMKNVNSST